MAESMRVMNALTKSQQRVKDLESQVGYLQEKIYEANKSMYQRFKDYIKDRVNQW